MRGNSIVMMMMGKRVRVKVEREIESVIEMEIEWARKKKSSQDSDAVTMTSKKPMYYNINNDISSSLDPASSSSSTFSSGRAWLENLKQANLE